MARRKVTMNEIVEVVYQCYQGAGVKAMSRSQGRGGQIFDLDKCWRRGKRLTILALAM